MLAYIALVLAGIFWALGFPFGKLALGELSAAHLILLRFVVAAIVALPFAVRGRKARALFRSPPVLLAGFLYGIAFLVQFEGLARSTVILAALLVGAMPALVAISARLLGEPVSRLSWIGVGAATAGAALIAGKPGDAGTPLGIALMLAALLLFLGWIHAARQAPTSADPLAVPSATLVIATLVLLPVTLLLHGPPPLHLSLPTLVSVTAAGLFSTFLATVFWQFGSPKVGQTVAGVFINLEPLVGAVIGITLFGDPAGLALVAGGILIVVGSVVTVLGENAPVTPTLPID